MVKNLWNQAEAEKLIKAAGADPADRALAAQIYASRLIGSNPALVQHGGGNTSCKVTRQDVFGNDISILHVKGSGADLAFITAEGMPGLHLQPLLELRVLDRLGDGDMVNVLRRNMVDTSGPNPSVETLLHAYLPHKVINHTHATAMLALANLPEAEAITNEIFAGRLAVVPFHMPGFELSKAAAEIYEANPDVEGLLLLNHGHFAFAGDARKAYDLTIRHTRMVEDWLKKKSGRVPKAPGKPRPDMAGNAISVMPALRGAIGAANAAFTSNRDAPMPVMDLRAGANIREFLGRSDLSDLAGRGVATPDHVIRTKALPLVLTHEILAGGSPAINKAVEDYIASYSAYFARNAARHQEKKIMLNPAPNLAWISGVGVVGMGRDARAARIASDLAEQNILAMSNAQDCGGFHPVNEAQLFDMEYWTLEQAKLGKAAPPALSGRIVMITGAGGTIGMATAQAFAAIGAGIFLVEQDQAALDRALTALGPGHGGMALDVTAANAADTATAACITQFGGLDILISNAGAAWSGEMSTLEDKVLRKSFELNFFAHQEFSKAAVKVFEAQGRGGQILFNVSKQAVNPGRGFGAYGLPKAATFFLLRQLALELGASGVRVNGVNADRIRSGLLDNAFIAERAKARGTDEATYMAGNLLQREVEARHVAEAFVALALSERTTAHVMSVDGGNIAAALR